MVFGPEVARTVTELEEHSTLEGKQKSDYRHHHQTFFKNTLKKLNSRTLKNPFIDEDDDEVIQLT